MKISTIKPTFITQRTNRLTADQGYTYNEPGITYNEPGVQYGGQYDHDISPLVSFAGAEKANLNTIKTISPSSRAREIKPLIITSTN